MEKFTTLEGVAAPLRIVNVDTDMIIPKQYLKTLKRTGLAKGLFSELRYRDDGSDNPDFVLNKPAYKSAKIIVAEDNFGCGSSREHAPQAIARRGIGAIVGESFGEIFIGNSLMIGLPCLAVAAEQMRELMAVADAQPEAEFVVDVVSSSVSVGDLRVPAFVPPSSREALVSGSWDATALLLDDYAAVERVAARLPYLSF